MEEVRQHAHGSVPQPVPAKVEDPCSVESATDELKFISKCAGESASDESLRKIIADGKAHNKCSIAKKIYLSKIYRRNLVARVR